MTVAQLVARLSVEEMHEWAEFHAMRQEAMKKATDDAKSGSGGGGGTFRKGTVARRQK